MAQAHCSILLLEESLPTYPPPPLPGRTNRGGGGGRGEESREEHFNNDRHNTPHNHAYRSKKDNQKKSYKRFTNKRGGKMMLNIKKYKKIGSNKQFIKMLSF